MRRRESAPDTGALRRSLTLLGAMSDEEIRELLGVSELVRFAARDVLQREGDAEAPLILLMRGAARLSRAQSSGPPTILGDVGPGAAIGALGLLDTGPASCSAEAIEASVALRVGRAGFYDLGARGRPAAYKLLRGLAPCVSRHMREVLGRVDAIFDDPAAGVAELERAVLAQAADGRRG